MNSEKLRKTSSQKSEEKSKEKEPIKKKVLRRQSTTSSKTNTRSQNKTDTQYNSARFNQSILGKIFSSGRSKVTCICKRCEEEVKVKSVSTHLKSKKHREKCTSVEKQELDNYFEELKAKRGISINDEEKKEDNKDQDVANYIELLSFCLQEKMSYGQVSRLGKFLQSMSHQKKLKFLKTSNFDKEEIANFNTQCLRPYFVEDLEGKLKTSLFSLSIDNATVCGENFCAMKIKYLESEKDNKFNSEITVVKNKLVAIEKLNESSTAEKLYEILNNKIFYDEDIKKNFIGMTHDRGSNLIGSHKGLVTRMKKDWPKYFWDLNDPCHSLNLVVKNSITILPKKLIKFITKSHEHFISPERRATLLRIQREEGKPQLYPKKWVKTRWLSLGETLIRLLKIWDSLTIYMAKNIPENSPFISELIDAIEPEESLYILKDHDSESDQEEKNTGPIVINCDEYFKLLNSKVFHLQIKFLSHIVNMLNKFNITFQDHSLEIFKVKQEIENCFNYFCLLNIIPSKRNCSLKDRLHWDWKNKILQTETFYKPEEFISNLLGILGDDFGGLKDLNTNEKNDFSNVFQPFIGEILFLLRKYLPFNDPILDCLDFVALIDTPERPFVEKILAFNEKFQIVAQKDIQNLSLEAMTLCSRIPHYLNLNKVKDSLHLWDIIQKSERFIYLHLVVRAAQTLPTSSSTIEQTFSVLGLFKDEKRSKLSKEGLEGLILLHQSFPKEKTFDIPKKLVSMFKDMKNSLNTRKTKRESLIRKGDPQEYEREVAEAGIVKTFNEKEVKRINENKIEIVEDLIKVDLSMNNE